VIVVVKAYMLMVRRPDVSQERFDAHWRDPHGPLVARVGAVKQYTREHAATADRSVPGLAPSPYDGIGLCWFATLHDALHLADDPNYAAPRADGPNFIDTERLARLYTTEHIVLPSRAESSQDAVKAVLLLRRRPGMDPTAFVAGVTDHVDRSVATLEGLESCAYALPIRSHHGDEPPHDAVVELAFRDEPAFRRACSAGGGGGGEVRAIAAFADMTTSHGMRTYEERVVWPVRP
jgi:uncharacterized protein (TIGR02118 family)